MRLLIIANARLITNGSLFTILSHYVTKALSHNGIIVDFSDLKSNSIELIKNVRYTKII